MIPDKDTLWKKYQQGHLVSWEELSDPTLMYCAIDMGITHIRISTAEPDVRTELLITHIRISTAEPDVRTELLEKLRVAQQKRVIG